MPLSGLQMVPSSRSNAASYLTIKASPSVRPRTKVLTRARLEAPERPSNDAVENDSRSDAFTELVALSKKQSVNRVQSVRFR